MERAPVSCVAAAVLLLLFAVPTAALPATYIVEPAFGAAGFAAPDVIPVSFWDLTLREMVIIAALAVTPVFVMPLEILFAAKVVSFLGFRRIVRANILASPVRSTLFARIREEPGISFAGLLDGMELSRGALTYHLMLLRLSGKIVFAGSHGITRYFENSDRYESGEREMITYLRQDTDRQILLALQNTSSLSRQDFEKLLGVSGPTVTWHMKRLAGDGLLSIRKDGRYSRYSLSDRAIGYFRKHGGYAAALAGRQAASLPVAGPLES